MKLLVDANAPRSLVEELRQAGYDVAWIREINKAMPDPEIVDLAAREDRVIVTADKGFSALVFYSGKHCPGIILSRVQNLVHRNHRILSILKEKGKEIRGNFSVITDHAVRMRKIRNPEQ